jgi:hypothetical protein
MDPVIHVATPNFFNHPRFLCATSYSPLTFQTKTKKMLEFQTGLAECSNAVILPHIASASLFTRGGMATLAACNVAARLRGDGVWATPDNAKPFLEGSPSDVPRCSPSIVNAKELGVK